MFQFRFPGKRGRTQSDPVAAIFGEIKRQVPWCRRDVLGRLLELSIEIAREGREGRRIREVVCGRWIWPESCRKAFWRNAPADELTTLPRYAA